MVPGKSKFEKKTIEIFSEEEVIRIIEAANIRYKNGVYKYKNGWGIVLMICTGIRLAEATAQS